MPWCPKCKNEYREGIEVCSECGVALVDKLIPSDSRPVMFGELDQMELVKEYLEYNNLKNLEILYDDSDSVYELYVPDSKFEEAAKLVKVFVTEELSRAEKEDEALDTDTDTNLPETKQYVNSADWAEENKSSGWMLLIVGILGLIVVILGILGIIPLRLGNQYLFYGVLSAVFILFIVMGLISMKNAKIFLDKAKSENSLMEELDKWARESLNKDAIDETIPDKETLSDEELYFKRIEKLNDLINRKFINLDKAFVDHYIDETLYDLIFAK